MGNLVDLSKQIFEANKAKGFHQDPEPLEQQVCLIMTELAEIIEADRAGKRADIPAFDQGMESVSVPYNARFNFSYHAYIKGTVEDEIADSVMRLLDTAQLFKFNINAKAVQDWAESVEDLPFNNPIVPIVHCTLKEIANFSEVRPTTISIAVGNLLALSNILGFDLFKQIEIKMKYNTLRPHKHGKAY